jgi:thioredoxin-dependent peroxiredoxin
LEKGDFVLPSPSFLFSLSQIDSDELFKGHRVVIFTINGVFLPLCSKSSYVPNYEKYYDAIRSLGIDDVYCLSVNDFMCCRQWGLRLGLQEEAMNPTSPLNPGNFKKVKVLPDGELHFTRGMGMNTHLEGIGERSWRYSMVVNDGIIEKMFVEEVFVVFCLLLLVSLIIFCS